LLNASSGTNQKPENGSQKSETSGIRTLFSGLQSTALHPSKYFAVSPLDKLGVNPDSSRTRLCSQLYPRGRRELPATVLSRHRQDGVRTFLPKTRFACSGEQSQSNCFSPIHKTALEQLPNPVRQHYTIRCRFMECSHQCNSAVPLVTFFVWGPYVLSRRFLHRG